MSPTIEDAADAKEADTTMLDYEVSDAAIEAGADRFAPSVFDLVLYRLGGLPVPKHGPRSRLSPSAEACLMSACGP